MQPGGGDPDIEYAAIDDRALIKNLFHDEGVFDTVFGSLKVTQRSAGANFSVDVAAGAAWIFGDDVSGQGMYLVQSDAVENLTIPSPPGAGTRTHRVVAQVRDKLHNSTDWSSYEFTLDVLEDTGSGTPALPDSAISLATVAVDAGQVSVTDSDITDARVQACLITSKYPLVSSDSSRPPNPFESELIYRLDKGCYEAADSAGSWREIPRRDGGGSAWTAYTPTLTATSSNPTLGTGSTRTGAYMQIGKMVTVRVTIKFGTSGTAAGSGTYEVSLPVTAKTITVGRQQGSATFFDNSATDFGNGAVFIDNGATTKAKLSMDSTVVTNSAPWTWGANDQLDFTLTYEAA
jgi:hypothetical protein